MIETHGNEWAWRENTRWRIRKPWWRMPSRREELVSPEERMPGRNKNDEEIRDEASGV